MFEKKTKKQKLNYFYLILIELILGRLAIAFGWIVLNYIYLIVFRKGIM